MEKTPFLAHLGVRVTSTSFGECETSLELKPEHAQQNGYAHAGVLVTLADHTAGAAACTQLSAGQGVLTIELKINFLRPAEGTHLRCVAQALRVGKTIAVVESSVFAGDAQATPNKLVAKAMITLAVVPYGASGTPPSGAADPEGAGGGGGGGGGGGSP